MREPGWKVAAIAALVIGACGGEAYPCTAEVHCHLEDGEPVCDDGYERASPDDPGDLRCEAVECNACTDRACGIDPVCGVECGVCDAPPAPYCRDASVLVRFESAGVCDGGSCTYVELTTTCPSGCDAASASCTGCTDECPSLGAQSCEGGAIRVCEEGALGCLAWGAASACPSGACASAESCGGCTDACVEGATECTGGEARSCARGSLGCTAWGAFAPCADGVCADASSCGSCDHACDAGAEACMEGSMVDCTTGTDGCRAWTVRAPCDEGACNAAGTACSGCPVGYENVGTDTAPSCVDVDECARSLDDCDTNATCANTPGGFECSCPPEYLDDASGCHVLWDELSTGELRTCGVTRTGELHCWGETEIDPTSYRAAPARVGSDSDWARVAVGMDHNCAIKTDGRLYCWGDGYSGRLGNGSTSSDAYSPRLVNGGGAYASVAVGDYHSCGIRTDGTLWCWGSNDDGQLGLGGAVFTRSAPAQVGTETSWARVFAHDRETCALKSDDTLFCWGENGGTLGTGTASLEVTIPTQVAPGTGWRSIGRGDAHSCGVQLDGTLWCWGKNDVTGTLGASDTSTYPLTRMGSDSDWVAAAASWHTSCALKSSGDLYCWGANDFGQLGVDHTIGSPAMQRAGGGYAAIDLGFEYACALESSGAMRCWGRNLEGQLGVGRRATFDGTPVQVERGPSSWTSLLVGASFACGFGDSALHCFGANYHNQQGTLLTDRVVIPRVITGDWIAVAPGADHMCAIDDEGLTWCSGSNLDGQLGTGSYASELTRTTSSTRFASIAGGGDHTCAIAESGALHCWGESLQGQLGGASLSTPIDANTWTQVSAGAWHTCAIRSDQSLYCWGANDGRLGDGTTDSRTTPVRAGTATWRSVSAGSYQTCGIGADEGLYCWGAEGPQLGLGEGAGARLSPTRIGTASWRQVAAGWAHVCAVRTDDALFCWGGNAQGQLGTGDTTTRWSPVEVQPGTRWRSVGANRLDGFAPHHTCGIRTDGSAWCWGEGAAGQLGSRTSWWLVPTPVVD